MNSDIACAPIVFRNVSYFAGGRQILVNIASEFAGGKTTLLTGPSGCGKTSLLRLIAGLESPSAGEIYHGSVLFSSSEKILSPWLRNLDMLFQSDSLWPDMTLEAQINYVRARNDGRVVFDMAAILERLQIRQLLTRKPAGLSGGEARRCQLARVLAGSPSIFLFDEPLAAQDAVTAEATAGLLCDILPGSGITAVVVSHETALFSKAGWPEVSLPQLNAQKASAA